MKNLTKSEVAEVREALEHVPKTRRKESWKKATAFLDRILEGGSNLAIRKMADEFRYSAKCELCKTLIAVGAEYVSTADGYRHYDCNMANAEEDV
jgi:hypothetical protein